MTDDEPTQGFESEESSKNTSMSRRTFLRQMGGLIAGSGLLSAGVMGADTIQKDLANDEKRDPYKDLLEGLREEGEKGLQVFVNIPKIDAQKKRKTMRIITDRGMDPNARHERQTITPEHLESILKISADPSKYKVAQDGGFTSIVDIQKGNVLVLKLDTISNPKNPVHVVALRSKGVVFQDIEETNPLGLQLLEHKDKWNKKYEMAWQAGNAENMGILDSYENIEDQSEKQMTYAGVFYEQNSAPLSFPNGVQLETIRPMGVVVAANEKEYVVPFPPDDFNVTNFEREDAVVLQNVEYHKPLGNQDPVPTYELVHKKDANPEKQTKNAYEQLLKKIPPVGTNGERTIAHVVWHSNEPAFSGDYHSLFVMEEGMQKIDAASLSFDEESVQSALQATDRERFRYGYTNGDYVVFDDGNRHETTILKKFEDPTNGDIRYIPILRSERLSYVADENTSIADLSIEIVPELSEGGLPSLGEYYINSSHQLKKLEGKKLQFGGYFVYESLNQPSFDVSGDGKMNIKQYVPAGILLFDEDTKIVIEDLPKNFELGYLRKGEDVAIHNVSVSADVSPSDINSGYTLDDFSVG